MFTNDSIELSIRPVLSLATDAIKNIIPPDIGPVCLEMRIVNLPDQNKISIRGINEHLLGKFITVSGQVVEIGRPHLAFTELIYSCLRCGFNNVVDQPNPFKEKGPYECDGCQKTANQTSFQVKDDDSTGFIRRFITVQENPEEARHGGEPGTIEIILNGFDLVNAFSLGGRYKFNGILRQTKDLDKEKYRTFYLECNSIESEDDVKTLEATAEEMKEFRKMAKRDNVLGALASKMATSVFGHTMEKKIILLQILGGVSGISRSDGSLIRGDIHVLFVGDPGTAKSQLLRFAHHIAPRSMYASGPRSTKAGLIGTYVEGRNGNRVYRAGALPKADGGFCVIDEFEKMTEKDSQGIHEAMEQQHTTISMAYGRVDVLTRCPVLAAANPESQRFHGESNVGDQITLKPAMTSRFDLILPFIDSPDITKDADISRHILLEHKNAIRDMDEKGVDSDNIIYIKKYIMAAKEYTPILTDKAIKHLVTFYAKKRAESSKMRLTLTARNNEGLERLACASAKSRFSDKVELKDAEVACELVEYFLEQIHSDIGIVVGGSRETIVKGGKMALFDSAIRSFTDGVSEDELFEKAKGFGLSHADARACLNRALDRGECFHQSSDRIKPVNRRGGYVG